MWQIRPLNWAVNYVASAQDCSGKVESSWQVDSPIRSLTKAISYRAGGLTVTVLVVWALTGKMELAAAAGITDTCLKLGLYYFHERIWNRITFGLKPH